MVERPDPQAVLLSYRDILRRQTFYPEDRDLVVVEGHLKLLEALASMDGVSIALFDLAERRYRFLRTAFKELLGLDESAPEQEGLEFFRDRIHPDDMPLFYQWSVMVFEYLLTRPVEERKSYRSFCDYRLATAGNGYIRIAQQNTVLELDRKGNIWLILSLQERSKLKDLELPLRRSLRNKSTGEYVLFPESDRSIFPLLSAREHEILGYIARGYNSRDISDLLGISLHTVNTHRRNILGKLNAENSAEAVRYVSDRGLI